MRSILLSACAIMFLLGAQKAHAQIPKSLKNAGNRMERKAERKVEKNATKKMEKGIDNAFEGKKKEKKEKNTSTPSDSTKKTSFNVRRVYLISEFLV